MLLRLFRVVVAVAAVITVILFAYVYVQEHYFADKTIPQITVETELLDVKATATDADLLKGVTAYDEKDGDLTDKLLVESIGVFTEIGYCRVTYAVCDSDNHVVTANRRIHYTNYEPPKFTMNAPLLFSAFGTLNVVGIVGATDCLDGDISQNVIIYSPDYETGQVGTFSIQATVKNSKGDSASIVLPLVIDKKSGSAPQIELETYLIYVRKGRQPDWYSYIGDTIDHTGLEGELEFAIETDYDAWKEGLYSVDYYGTDEAGYIGRTRLLVVVE